VIFARSYLEVRAVFAVSAFLFNGRSIDADTFNALLRLEHDANDLFGSHLLRWTR